MLKEAIGTGATVELAKADAVAQLGISADADYEIEVLEMPTKKMFGLLGTTPAKVKISVEVASNAGARDYLDKILSSLGIEGAEIAIEESDEEVSIKVEYDGDYGAAIGRRGETLDAIQYLVRLVVNRGADKSRRVSLNIGNYREKREATLRALAQKNAAKVKKYGRNVVLDPMNPYERRIIHTALQEIEGVTSHSVGSENDRKVVITLEEGFKPTNGGSRGGRGNGGRGGYQNRGRGGRDNRSYDRDRASAPSRPPRSDAASASRYGKIEPAAKQNGES